MAEQFRVEVFGEGRGPWRNSHDAAMEDAKALELASWDGESEEWFLPVPAGIERRVVRDRSQLSRHGDAWNESDVALLRLLARQGKDIGAISSRLGRSREACAAKARRLQVEVATEGRSPA